jgi:hypothetical protein
MLLFVAMILGFSIMRENPRFFSIVVLLALSIIIARSHKQHLSHQQPSMQKI